MARITKTMTVVQCAKLGLELEALNRPPFPGPLGERIYNEISQAAFELWQGQSTLLINHYGLNLADPQAQEFLFKQMETYFFGDGSGMPISGAPAGGKGGAPRK